LENYLFSSGKLTLEKVNGIIYYFFGNYSSLCSLISGAVYNVINCIHFFLDDPAVNTTLYLYGSLSLLNTIGL
jgi:hypothetical protein